MVRFALQQQLLPFRPRVAADAYAKVWMREGSPLLVYGKRLRDAVARQLGADYQVAIAMRYGEPSIKDALTSFSDERIDHILVLPLFPQFASSSTGSALEAVYREAGRLLVPPKLEVLPAFYNDRHFIGELAARAQQRFRVSSESSYSSAAPVASNMSSSRRRSRSS